MQKVRVHDMAKRKRHGLRAGIFLLVILFLAGFWWFENFTFHVVEMDIPSAKVKEPIRILHMSDLHSMCYGKDNRSLKNKIDKLDPDLIVATGDMATANDSEGQDRVVSLLTSFEVPVYFVPGEHDREQAFSDRLEQEGVKVLRYETDQITIKGTDITLYGIDNAYFNSHFDLEESFGQPDENRLNLLLAHIPNYDAYLSFGADMTLCGDTHGGMVRLPFVGPVYLNGHWFPKFTTNQLVVDKGVFEKDGNYLLVSGGLGNYPFPLRLFNRPEMSLVTLQPASS